MPTDDTECSRGNMMNSEIQNITDLDKPAKANIKAKQMKQIPKYSPETATEADGIRVEGGVVQLHKLTVNG